MKLLKIGLLIVDKKAVLIYILSRFLIMLIRLEKVGFAEFLMRTLIQKDTSRFIIQVKGIFI
ncbi:hypothetical protein D3Y59_17655 [Hymenobacter oligotrophus]|uniref:Uncharacterized protein n=1 Tax=Hymenobacter oligotrophus TaxID=2319843 RepID=A0A3B7R3X6_9BACT|nr:hypothetical protein D3Y59_17655 [Hymenobacter oligotrophus]